MKRSVLYTLIYAAVLGSSCALLLTAAASFTAPYKAANAEVEEQWNILAALLVPVEAGASSEQINEIFATNVRDLSQGDTTMYGYVPPTANGQVQAVAVQFAGPGLWGPVKGILALEADRRTIRGITFYEHEETPGLGGEITSAGFRDQFVGKSIVDQYGKPGMRIRTTAGELEQHEVHGITGATMTCDKVEAMLNAVIEKLVGGPDNHGR